MVMLLSSLLTINNRLRNKKLNKMRIKNNKRINKTKFGMNYPWTSFVTNHYFSKWTTSESIKTYFEFSLKVNIAVPISKFLISINFSWIILDS